MTRPTEIDKDALVKFVGGPHNGETRIVPPDYPCWQFPICNNEPLSRLDYAGPVEREFSVALYRRTANPRVFAFVES